MPQLCRFCWNHISENLNGRCPACRQSYKTDTSPKPSPEEYVAHYIVSHGLISDRPNSKIQLQKRPATAPTKERDAKRAAGVDPNSKKQFSDVRVIQRNLVYVTNLALSAAKEEVRCFLIPPSTLLIFSDSEATRLLRQVWQDY